MMLDRLLPALVLLAFLNFLQAAEEAPYGIDHRIPWTSSRVVGSPDPPLPYTVEKTLTRIPWKAPIFLLAEPGTDRLLVIQGGGETDRPSRILRVPDEAMAGRADPFLVMSNRLIYSIAFHPGYSSNGLLYVFSHGASGPWARTNWISRFQVERAGIGRCDPSSEQIILHWHSEGHDGGGLAFGHDGMLYVSTGDGTSDSDGWVTGQDLSDLCGGILRVNVDQADGARPYSVPADNPFVGRTNARPELWAYGLRNPWRLSVDQKTGRIWAGNNGQDLWETAHLIRRGENYGWSVYEGSHPFYLNRPLGPTPAVAPTVEHSHAEFRSLTGGVVYFGEQFPELNGVYIYGDYSSGEIWGARHDGSRVTWWRPLARTQLQITSFALDHHGGLLITDHGGALYRLVASPRRRLTTRFPTRLSETGLFLSTKTHQVAPGLIPYSVKAPAWSDGAVAQRFLALPGNSSLGRWTNGAVLLQTLSLEGKSGKPDSSRRVETRLLAFQDGQWHGYSYRWKTDQSDATLVEAKGEDKEFVLAEATPSRARRRQVWHYPSRSECMMCHSRAANFVLGATELELDRVQDYGGVSDNQLRTLQHIGVFVGTLPKSSPFHLVDPYDTSQELEARARSYLQVNCAVCHVEAGGGNARMELGITTARERMGLFECRPQHDTFGLDNAMLVFPGDPHRSILYQRLSRRGRGQMPPLGSRVVDDRAVALMREWIAGMKPSGSFVREWKMEDLLPDLDRVQRGRSFENGRAVFRQAGCGQCHRFDGEGGSVGPDLAGVGRRLNLRELLESLIEPSKVIATNYATIEIETRSNELFAGRIEREDEQVVVIRPLSATEEAVSVRKKEIRRRAFSTVSNMPAGMANVLSEEQILDLLAYLRSDGKAEKTDVESVPK